MRTVIVHPTTIRVQRREQGPTEFTETCGHVDLLGETSFGGPIVVAWDSASVAARHPERGHDVVLHEFAHKLDMVDGMVDGTPRLLDQELRDEWIATCTAVFDALVDHGDPVIDEYGATDPGEFFAVVTEVFFTTPEALAQEHPELYRLFGRFYGQDPLRRLRRIPRRD